MKKRQHAYIATIEEARIEKLTRVEGPLLFDNDNKDTEVKKLVHTKKDVHKSLADGYKYKRGKLSSPNVASLDKVKGSEMGCLLPSTSMVAHAIDELIEAIKREDKSEGTEVIAIDETGAADNRAGLSYMPPPSHEGCVFYRSQRYFQNRLLDNAKSIGYLEMMDKQWMLPKLIIFLEELEWLLYPRRRYHDKGGSQVVVRKECVG